jgi:hypothetical protein
MEAETDRPGLARVERPVERRSHSRLGPRWDERVPCSARAAAPIYRAHAVLPHPPHPVYPPSPMELRAAAMERAMRDYAIAPRMPTHPHQEPEYGSRPSSKRQAAILMLRMHDGGLAGGSPLLPDFALPPTAFAPNLLALEALPPPFPPPYHRRAAPPTTGLTQLDEWELRHHGLWRPATTPAPRPRAVPPLPRAARAVSKPSTLRDGGAVASTGSVARGGTVGGGSSVGGGSAADSKHPSTISLAQPSSLTLAPGSGPASKCGMRFVRASSLFGHESCHLERERKFWEAKVARTRERLAAVKRRNHVVARRGPTNGLLDPDSPRVTDEPILAPISLPLKPPTPCDAARRPLAADGADERAWACAGLS